MNKVVLRIVGVFSKELFHSFKGVFDNSDISNNEWILFCGYSDFDVPLEYTFNSILNDKEEVIFKGQIILKKVTQQWAEYFDMIPHGYKTICKFEFKEGIPDAVKKLPVVKSWFESNQYIFFVG